MQIIDDPITDVGFGMCLIGLIFIISCGLLLSERKENWFDRVIIIGSVVAAIGGLMILVRIA